MSRALVWFRLDLRAADNPALHHAAQAGAILPVFIWDTTDPWDYGGAAKWWLHHSLAHLQQRVPLLLQRGNPKELIPELVRQHDISHVYWNRCYEPHAIARDSALKHTLQEAGISVHTYNGRLLHEPWEVQNQAGGYFKVFTPFWKTASQRPVPPPLPAPPQGVEYLPPEGPQGAESLADWRLLPTQPDWASGLRAMWSPGETGAWQRLQDFLTQGLTGYAQLRDRPDLPHVSRLSPHLHWGEISPSQIWHHVQHLPPSKDSDKFLAEVGWREFSHHLLYHHPTLPTQNLRPEFNQYPWQDADGALQAWQRGRTGYPMVDAGMRELYTTGYLHNRVRMIVASFLIKHLRLHWRHGEDWFWDTLCDADLANNAASWQWVAGSGADAAPYFRIFNPITQAEKFDPDGAYIRQWVPELRAMPTEFIGRPWEAPALVLQAAGVRLGETYPHPIVDHAQARTAALAGYESIKKSSAV